ncbi:MAG: ATP-binding protein [Candidatus Omnitrophica bacterium]|nr:ATP-binding protein [Candidatus Omnitrophota bacterium]
MSIYTEPAVGNNFFAREDILNSLLKSAKGIREEYRHNVAIIGRGLIGKSSLLLHFLGIVKDYKGLIPVYVSLKDTSFSEFCINYVTALLYHSLRKQTQLKGDNDLRSLEEIAKDKFPKTCEVIRRIRSLLDEKDYNEAFSELFNLNTILSSESGSSIVVVLDEFDILSRFPIRKPFQLLGQKIMIQSKTLFLLSSSSTLTARKILSEKLSLLFGGFDIIDIEAFTSDQAREFIKLQCKGILIPDDLLDFIITFTGGHPFYLGSIIHKINSAKRYGINKITSKHLSQVVAEILLYPSGAINQFFTDLLKRIRPILPEGDIFDILKTVLMKGKASEMTQKLTTGSTQFTNLLNLLLELGLVSKSGSLYAITDSVFKMWIEVRSKPRNLLFDFIPEEESTDYIKEAQDRISAFRLEARKSISEKVVELIASFNNEHFFIDERIRMLPHLSFLQQKRLNSNTTLIVTRAKKKWLFILSSSRVTEEYICEISKRLKNYQQSKPKIILMAMSGLDDTAKVMAKQKHIWIWNREDLNRLFKFYRGYNALIA